MAVIHKPGSRSRLVDGVVGEMFEGTGLLRIADILRLAIQTQVNEWDSW